MDIDSAPDRTAPRMTISYGRRLKYVAIAGLAGWLAGFLAAFPAEFFIGLRDTGGEPKLLAETMYMGLGIWFIWTLLLAFSAWLLFALPCALFVDPAWLVRFRRRVLVATALLALLMVMTKLWSYQHHAAAVTALRPGPYLAYGCFAVFFSVMTAWLYIRLVRHVA